MCESEGVLLSWCRVSLSPLKLIFESLQILSSNPLPFTSIMLLTTLPLSTLLISQSITTQPLTARIHRLESLAHHAPTRFEARHVWRESRHDASSLLRVKALFAIPSFFLSLAAAISAVHSTLTPAPTLHSAASALKHHSMRLSVTTIYIYALLLAFSPIPRAIAALTGSPLLVFLIGSGLEVYLMAVTSVALVVSVSEERFGWDAIRVASGLMEGNRVCGWVLSGLFVLGSSSIGSKVERLMDGEDSIGVEDKAVLIVSYGFMVLWSYVIMTVFYCHCRKQHPVKEAQPDPDELPLQQVNNSL
ncbi:uncharacterized protein LOC130710143 [Lotus japonicus]|uniref:uncharacterized protein LOC130710143 n=1 Tax=Lotus japonicus TaxID=34305 RepID=UPI00258B8E84|nr:uncharacterized protein LOC130710143 [Lotus japonicus]XP_057415284.1 uncharacterized protein LOC130710143 [Lotus japonicus]